MTMPLPPPVQPNGAQIKAEFIPNPAYQAAKAQEKATERSDKLESTAIEILKLAVEANTGQTLTAQQLADYAELLWRWTTTDNWQLPGDKA